MDSDYCTITKVEADQLLKTLQAAVAARDHQARPVSQLEQRVRVLDEHAIDLAANHPAGIAQRRSHPVGSPAEPGTA
jgi:hypothetical protein